jgi:hypothetical protein
MIQNHCQLHCKICGYFESGNDFLPPIPNAPLPQHPYFDHPIFTAEDEKDKQKPSQDYKT